MAEASVQPVPWVARRLDARRLEDEAAAGRVATTSRTMGPARWPPLTTTAAAPSASSRSAARRIAVERRRCAGRRSASASGTFGVTTLRARDEPALQRLDRALAREAACRSTPPSPDRPPAARRRALLASVVGDRLDDRGIDQHAGLDAVGADIVEHRLHLPPRRNRARTGTMRCTPSVFCAVSAVIAVAA